MNRRSPRLSPKMRTVLDTKVWSVLTPAMTCASSSWSLRLGLLGDLLRVDRDLDRGLEGRDRRRRRPGEGAGLSSASRWTGFFASAM